jgi:hypothetical protein
MYCRNDKSHCARYEVAISFGGDRVHADLLPNQDDPLGRVLGLSEYD